ncbi:type IV pilin, partial [archaeon]
MKKAISALIATVILVAITISMSAMVFSFFTGVLEYQTTAASAQIACAQKGALYIYSAMCTRVRDSSLVGYWRLESMNTSNYTSDLSGYSNDGKYFGEDFNTGTLTNM